MTAPLRYGDDIRSKSRPRSRRWSKYLPSYSFRLYVTGETTLSREAEANLRALCKNRLMDDYEIEIVDILESPALAEEEHIIATPTVMRLAPLPSLRVIGDLSDEEGAARAFGLPDRRFTMSGESE